MTTPKTESLPEVRHIPIEQVEPNPNNPRKTWTSDKDDAGHTSLQRLAESIKEQGILQPLVVMPHGDKFWIVCGERRYRASKQLADVKTIPCVVRTDLDEKSSLEASLTENLQREDLSPMDTAHAYHELITKCGYTARAIAKKLGVSPAAISQRLSLLKLSPELQADVHEGKLTESQGTAIAHAVSRRPAEKREVVLKDIKQRVDKARAKKTKLDTKDVKTIARTPAGKKSKPRIAPASPKEKKAVEEFFKTLDRVKNLLKPYEVILKDHAARRRHAELLLTMNANAVGRIRDSVDVLARVVAEADAVQRERKVA